MSFRVVLDKQNRTEFGGSGRLAGDPPDSEMDLDGRAKILNAPSRVDIVVLEPGTFAVIARATSRDDGTWEIPYLDAARQYTVLGVDVTRQVNSAIQDWVYPAEME